MVDPPHESGYSRQPQRIEWMAALSDADGAELDRMAISLQRVSGEVVYRSGDAATRVFLVRSGTVKLCRAARNGKEVDLAILGPGELFGERALTGAPRRLNRAEALELVTLWAFDARTFGMFIGKRPRLALLLTRIVGNRLERMETRIQDILFHDVRTRLARTLVDLALDLGKVCSEGYRIRPRLTQAELARLIGSTRETTSTIFNEFRRDGLVDTDAHAILVLDLERLRGHPGRGDGSS